MRRPLMTQHRLLALVPHKGCQRCRIRVTHTCRPQELETMIRMHLPIPRFLRSHVWMIVLSIVQLPQDFLRKVSSACSTSRKLKGINRRCQISGPKYVA